MSGGMDKETEGPQPPEDSQDSQAGDVEPPPFQPDPRLVTYLERGRKDDAERRFREATKNNESS